MRKIIIFIVLFLYGIFSAQIDIKINLDNIKSTMSITVINKTNDYYLLPFDKRGFKGYNLDEICSDFNNMEYPHRFFAPTLIFEDLKDNSIIEASMRNYHIDRLNHKNNEKLKNIELKENKKIIKWKRQNHFSNNQDAIRNLYLYENLITLKPKEKLNVEINMDVYNIRRANTYFYDYYVLTNNKKYDLSINLCSNENIYNYLTEKQKKSLNRYKLFTGNIVSNKIEYIYNDKN